MTHVKRMLISADPQEVRVAIVEGGKLSEAYIERRGRRSIVGNIYKGRVDAVLPGMEAAFVDIGLPKNGFLYVAEIVLPELDDRERRSKRIQELIQSGQDVLVQVTKDPMGSKGARLTMDVSLAGRFMVLAPGGDGVGVSKKLEGPERDRLRDLLRKMKTHEDAGLIARTAAQGASLDELERDVRLLEKLWDVSRGHAQRAEAPALVYSEPDLSLQMVRDDFRADVAELVIDDERQYHRILAYVRRTSPELAERVKLYKGKRPLFQRYEIEQGIRSTLSRRVPLPSGGSLVFDYGEAFTVVDVNTGRFTGTTKKLEDTILKNNLEAAVEVVRQLRLRDIGGIIVVDFIDMASQKNRDAVLEVLQRELKKDRSKVYVVEISPLGLVEMTRKNVADGVREIMTCECPTCEGTGRVLSDESLAIDMLRNLRRVARESKSEAFRVELEDGVARALIGAGGTGLDELEHETGRAFDVVGPPRRAARALRDPGRGHAATRSAPRRRPARRATSSSCPIAGAAPLRRDRRRVAAQRRLRGPGHRRAALRGHARSALRIERATRFAAQAALLDVEPMRPAPPSAPRPAAETPTAMSSTASPTSSSPSAASASASTSRVACAGRSAARPPSSAASAPARAAAAAVAAAAAAEEAVAAATAPRRPRPRAARAMARSTPRRASRARPKTARQRPSAVAAAAAEAGEAAAGAAAATERAPPARTAAAEVVANGAPAEPAVAAAAVSDRPPEEPGAARPRQQQRRRRSSSSSGSGGANGASREREREPAPAAPAAPAPAPEPAAKRAPATPRHGRSKRGRAPQGPDLAHPQALRRNAQEPGSDPSSPGLTPSARLWHRLPKSAAKPFAMRHRAHRPREETNA